ncbi:phage infection protein [Alicyclobacillus hesperidum]|uniref:Phage infection protein n=1 Tax=Alicyclobacillus hesperidum TaxID=89784 RepID=A0A1H2TTP1_9BACL|nr:YhgE/Pip domain-containing protein [Alicyclobacillus hesperidum]GLV13978.1 phage infection protein [Alicyclobacillus hesperidum]SDW46689.1 putative membrane protein [Alicyclobacillus hesperidum]
METGGFWATVGQEWSSNLRSWRNRIQVFGILLIPVLYAATFLWAFWNPYGHLERLPVAVVNEDRGATLDGKRIDAGAQMVNRLKTDHNLGWRIVNAKEAEQGMVNGTYIMTITIPSNFSQEAANAATQPGAPQPTIQSVTNDRHNYIAGIVGRNAMVKLEEQTASQLARSYAENVVSGLVSAQAGIRAASRGASQVAAGAGKLEAASGSLMSGAQQVESGATRLANNLQTAATGAGQVASGAAKAQQAATQLAAGMAQLTQGAAQVQTGAKQLQSGSAVLATGADRAATGASQVAGGAQQVADGLAALAKANPALAGSAQFQSLLTASQQVAAGSAQVASANQSLAANARKLASGAGAVAQGSQALTTGIDKASSGAQQLAVGDEKVARGASQLAAGMSGLQGGAARLASGAQGLRQGIGRYTNGVASVTSGAQTLASHLQSAAQSMPTVHHTQIVNAIADPVGVHQLEAGNINTYGNGFAPYFLSLGLYVGVLLMSVIISFRDPPSIPSSGFAWFASKWLMIGAMAVVQALLADLVLLAGLGVHTTHPVWFVLFSVLTSLVFAAILLFFVAAMQNPGRFIGVILLILQLTSSSGTYPVVLSPKFFQKLGPWLPMHYTVDGFRYIIGGGNSTAMTTDIWRLMAYGIVFLALSCVFFAAMYRRRYKGAMAGKPATLQA